MIRKICFLGVMTLGILGCGVELRNRNHVEPGEMNELIVEKEYSVAVPKDTSGQTVMSFDRLVLRPGAKFYTQGLNLKLQIGELISEGGTIATFEDNKFANPQTKGRDGGNLDLVLGHAAGKLTIELRGEDGGAGASGQPPDALPQGAKGATGKDALCMGLPSHTYGPVAAATSGGPGAPGLPGFPGGSGFKGGDSGAVFLKAMTTENFEVTVQKIPGKGGPGGLGGKGGAGGLGGDPGTEGCPLIPQTQHFYTTTGPAGAEGPQGPPGAPGPDGVLQPACLLFGTAPAECSSDFTFHRGQSN
jgi:hypothetical protein